jgi:hypothetical protein
MPLSNEAKESLRRIHKSYRHPDKLGAGAAKREHLDSDEKVAATMGEFKRHTLYSGSGHKVTNRAQAIAIALKQAGKSKQ